METNGHDDGEGSKNDLFFVEDRSSGDNDEDITHPKYEALRFSRDSSPPLLLAFPCGRVLLDRRLSPGSSLSVEEEDEEEIEQPIEDWMILGSEEDGDSSIQLNLSYWNSDEEDSGDADQKQKPDEETWAVSEKDKFLPSRYFGHSLICNFCNRTGHLAKSCYYHKKCPICILCGIQGHIQRDCPGRPCPHCGLPSHGFTPCDRALLWNQHCQRCGTSGHLSDVCPDTWRQYHLTIRLEVPRRPQTRLSQEHRRSCAHCYNCSQRGHYGHECSKRTMISGTSPSLPYVCHYDTMEDILRCPSRTEKKDPGDRTELKSTGSLTDQPLVEPRAESGEENPAVQLRSRTKQETFSRAARRKTWPERRRERREVKRLRREAQARREGGLLGRCWGRFEDDVFTADPVHSQRQPPPPPQNQRRDEEGGRGSRKSREAERFRKRRGIKHGDFHPCGENISSPEQRVRHRRR